VKYCWKALDKGYNIFSNLISIGGLHAKLCAPKAAEVPSVGISGSHFGVLEKNDIWVLVPWPAIEYIIRGKVVASPKSKPW
jgi:hypothetical protein